MKSAHSYLISQDKSDPDVKKFKDQLYDIWFKLYSRLVCCNNGSCNNESRYAMILYLCLHGFLLETQ